MLTTLTFVFTHTTIRSSPRPRSVSAAEQVVPGSKSGRPWLVDGGRHPLNISSVYIYVFHLLMFSEVSVTASTADGRRRRCGLWHHQPDQQCKNDDGNPYARLPHQDSSFWYPSTPPTNKKKKAGSFVPGIDLALSTTYVFVPNYIHNTPLPLSE
jgi:hypothetical protein